MNFWKISVIVSMFIFACGDNPLPPQPNGSECMDNEECESDYCLIEFEDGNEVTGGMCTMTCDWNVPITCPENELCLRYRKTDEYVCFQECEKDKDCREDWSCDCIGFFCSVKACIPEDL